VSQSNPSCAILFSHHGLRPGNATENIERKIRDRVQVEVGEQRGKQGFAVPKRGYSQTRILLAYTTLGAILGPREDREAGEGRCVALQ